MLMSSSLSAHAMGLRSIWTFTRALTRRPLPVLHDSTILSNNKLHNGLALTPQMGMTDMVFPGAVHTRFEHSLGVCWLAGDAVYQLLSNHGLDLDIDHFDIQNVKLAGLLHDLGHVPFSHMFESELLPWILHHRKWHDLFLSTFIILLLLYYFLRKNLPEEKFQTYQTLLEKVTKIRAKFLIRPVNTNVIANK